MSKEKLGRNKLPASVVCNTFLSCGDFSEIWKKYLKLLQITLADRDVVNHYFPGEPAKWH